MDRFALLGISQGGAVGVEYTVRHPGRVSHLIMLGAFARGSAKRTAYGSATREAMLTLMREGWGRDNPAFRQMWTSLFVPDGTLEHMRWFNELQRMTTSPDNAVRLISADQNVDVRPLLPALHVPTLVIHARHDAVCPLSEGRVAGTLPYMAPEVLRGAPADARSDIWSLGVVLYEVTTGDLPFGGATGFELTSAILRDPPKRWPAYVPAGLRAVVERCLAKEPGQRYQRASEVRVALETLQTGTRRRSGRSRP